MQVTGPAPPAARGGVQVPSGLPLGAPVLEQWLSGLTAHRRPLGNFKNANVWMRSSEKGIELVWDKGEALGSVVKVSSNANFSCLRTSIANSSVLVKIFSF